MKTIAELFSADWANALGWSLFHSVWQGLVILLIVVAFLRAIPTKFSRVRYATTSAGMFLLIVSFLSTYNYLAHDVASTAGFRASTYQIEESIAEMARPATAPDNVLMIAESFINENMQLILACWIAGFMFSVLRLTNSLYCTYRLSSTAHPLENQWSNYIRDMGSRLGISRVVRLAESASISTPVVIGYLKPIIVIPLGMLTGLTTEQVETIFIHELAHVKRHDYLINLIQSVVETIFFFNPFVLVLSSLIQREREYCCDDLVVKQHGGAKAYAYALTTLAEVRLIRPAFALPLADNKNHLLNRITRIMEKSAKNYSAKGRMVFPAVLLIAGLLCVSWLGISPDHGSKNGPQANFQDTVKGKKSEKAAKFTRKEIITIDENGQPHEEVVVEFEGDEELRPLMGIPDVPVGPPLPNIGVMPAIPGVPVIPPVPDIEGIPDTIPLPSFPFRNAEEWEEFSKSMDEQMGKVLEKISALRDGEEFRAMQEFKEKFESGDWQERFFGDSTSFGNVEQQLRRLQELEFKGLQERLERFQEFDLKNLEQQLQQLQEPLRNMENNFLDREANVRKFEEELRHELIKDGYLSQQDAIESIEWDDSSLKVNGKEIKEGDRAKYQELYERLK